jgi:hypothetical protein
MKSFIYAISILALVLFQQISANAQAIIDLETGAVFNGYNDVRIPGNQGTLFSLTDDLQSEPQFFYRLRAGYIINSRHTISALYAPLETVSNGSIPNNVDFAGETYAANTQLNGTYKFNSYRLTYRYDFVQNPNFEFGLGATAKIRDARIALSSADFSSEKTDFGFVPIINFRLFWQPRDKFGFILEGDALGSGQGRAIDAQAAATYDLSENLRLRGGYRILEGGADNDEVYNFSLFHYASVGISYTFLK